MKKIKNVFKLSIIYALIVLANIIVIFIYDSNNTDSNDAKTNDVNNNVNNVDSTKKDDEATILIENAEKNKNEDKNIDTDAGKYVILTFDDGWDSQYKAFKISKPFKGTLYICPSLIDKKERLTLNNLREMYNNGWDISNHTVNHKNLSTMNLKDVYNEVYNCSSWISSHGFVRNEGFKHFAYPEGAYNKNIEKILQQQNILTARTTNAGNSTKNLLELGRTTFSGMNTKNVTNAIMSNQKLLILNFHKIVPDSTKNIDSLSVKELQFKAVIESINKSKRKVLTLTEWYKNYRKK